MNDPIVAEVRKSRDNHSKQFNYDILRISLEYQKKHEEYKQLLESINQLVANRKLNTVAEQTAPEYTASKTTKHSND